MVTEISLRHQREVFSPHPDDPYLSVEIGHIVSQIGLEIKCGFAELGPRSWEGSCLLVKIQRKLVIAKAVGQEKREDAHRLKLGIGLQKEIVCL